jgi:ADP-heptose:LPS heptosyltransferase
VDWTLMPNAAMERGIRLENWLPSYKTNWDVMKHFKFTDLAQRRAFDIKNLLGEFCVFYMGPLIGNTKEGHNRGPIWKPEDWIALGNFIQEELGLGIVVVGARWDESYYNEKICAGDPIPSWLDLIGTTSMDEVYAIISKSRFVISYQSGIGIVAEYMGIPTALFWRQKGDSLSSMFYASFDEKMNGAWSPPDMIASGKHMALYYGRHDVKYICDELVGRKW